MRSKSERALGYIRVSTQRQADGGVSLANQEERLAAHCQHHGIELMTTYADHGLSGTNDNRPGLQALMEHATRADSGVTQVVAYSFSRLFRDQFLLEDYRRKLKRAGVGMVAITQEVGQGAEGDLIRSVLAGFDEYQSQQTAKFTRDTMTRNAKDGFWNGSTAPLGYRSVTVEMRGPKAKKKLEIERSEALLVQQIYRMKRLGIGQGPMGYKKIVNHLNETGATNRGRKFHVSSVRDILMRSTYYGVHRWGVYDTREGIKRPEEDWQSIPVPAIIPKDEWDEVQTTIARNSRHITPGPVVSGPTMLAGLAKCGQPNCGNALTIATGKGGRYRYYDCSFKLRRGKAVCEGVRMRDSKLEPILIDALADRLLKRERLNELLAGLLDASSSAVAERKAQLKALRTEHTRVDGGIKNMWSFVKSGTVTSEDDDFKREYASEKDRRAHLAQEIALLEQQLSSGTRKITPTMVDRLGEVILAKLRSTDAHVRQGYARRFIEKVIVAPDKITIFGPVRALEIAASGNPGDMAPLVPPNDREWCPEEDSNLHDLAIAST